MADISVLQDALAGVVPDTGFMLDNRTALSHLQFIEQYARNVPYDPASGLSWADYLFMNGYTPEKLAALYQDPLTADGNLQPHQALLLAMFKMLETPRAFMNYFPDAHCDLYYRQLLALQERLAEPSQVALTIELDSTMAELMIPAGTLFSAGQDNQGTAIEFGLDEDLLTNHSTWSDLRWCLPPVGANSAGTSAIVYDEQQSWPEEGMRFFAPTEQDQAILTGRMLASTELTNDPTADTVFTLTFTDDPLIDGLRADISAGAQWLPLTVTADSVDTDSLGLTFTLPADSGEIAPPDGLAGAEFTVPVLRLSREDGLSVPLVDSIMAGEQVLSLSHFEQVIITPFGHTTYEALAISDMQLFLGISELLPGQSLSLFWKLNSPQPLTLTWYYLAADNQWWELGAQLVDETRNLFRSGVWSAILPDDASDIAPAMPPGRYWFRADIEPEQPETSQSTQVALYPWLTGLITNAMTATLNNVTTLDSSVVAEPLPADTIRQPVTDISGVASTEQPWESWGGRPVETSSEFVTRVAQRLSHRNRALTWPDMVMILKTAFPYVFDVMTPSGDVLTTVPALTQQRMIIIPVAAEKDNDDPLRPIFNAARLDAMSNFLQGLASLWQNILVENPRYTDVLLEYEVAFKQGVNPAWAKRELHETLTAHYMPWSTGASEGVSLASRIDYYDVMATVQQQPYVDHVISLTLDGDEYSVQGADDEVLILCWPEQV
ncbi:hypothetical protein [Serratia proteamaculans]